MSTGLRTHLASLEPGTPGSLTKFCRDPNLNPSLKDSSEQCSHGRHEARDRRCSSDVQSRRSLAGPAKRLWSRRGLGVLRRAGSGPRPTPPHSLHRQGGLSSRSHPATAEPKRLTLRRECLSSIAARCSIDSHCEESACGVPVRRSCISSTRLKGGAFCRVQINTGVLVHKMLCSTLLMDVQAPSHQPPL